MKKLYSKPELFFEDFSLMDSIASCGTKVGATEVTCSWTDPDSGWQIFNNQNICDTTPFDDTICYQVPTEDIILFKS